NVGDGTVIDLDTALTTFTAFRVGAGLIDVPKIGTLKITGNATRSLVGDFHADVHVSGIGVLAGKSSVGTVTVAGAVDGADITILNGNVGLFQTARFLNSTLFDGFTPTTPTDLFQGGTFTKGLKIVTFTVTAGTGGFANSYVAADVIGT